MRVRVRVRARLIETFEAVPSLLRTQRNSTRTPPHPHPHPYPYPYPVPNQEDEDPLLSPAVSADGFTFGLPPAAAPTKAMHYFGP